MAFICVLRGLTGTPDRKETGTRWNGLNGAARGLKMDSAILGRWEWDSSTNGGDAKRDSPWVSFLRKSKRKDRPPVSFRGGGKIS